MRTELWSYDLLLQGHSRICITFFTDIRFSCGLALGGILEILLASLRRYFGQPNCVFTILNTIHLVCLAVRSTSYMIQIFITKIFIIKTQFNDNNEIDDYIIKWWIHYKNDEYRIKMGIYYKMMKMN